MQAISILIYLIFLSGIFLFAGKDMSMFFKSLSLRKRLGKAIGSVEHGKIYRFTENLLSAISKEEEVDPVSFLFFLGMLFLAILLLCLKSLKPLTALIAAFSLTSLPVLFLYTRMESERTKNSKEGISMVTEFYRQYRMKNLNVYEALEATISAEGDYPGCRKQLYKLLLKLRASSGQAEIRRTLEDFSFALGTTWGKMFATCIRLSAEKGDDVSEGLADIIAQLKTAGEMAEERKRLNSEAARMTMYLVPILYIGTMALAVYYLDVNPGRLFVNQFFTAEGLLFFLGTVFLFVFNLILLKLIDNTRLDY